MMLPVSSAFWWIPMRPRLVQVEGHFHKIVSRIAFVIVHNASNKSHTVVVERSSANAQLLVDLHIHFVVLVIARCGDQLGKLRQSYWGQKWCHQRPSGNRK
jgi:hypothetical protein